MSDQPPSAGVVTSEDLGQLPSLHRRMVALYLAALADEWLTSLDGAGAEASAAALRSAAAQLVDPVNNTTPSAARVRTVLESLALDGPGVDTADEPTGVLSLGHHAYVGMTYYSAALEEIYGLRAALAHEAQVRAEDLTRASYPSGRRQTGHDAIARMTAAARGNAADAYTRDVLDRKAALAAAGADDCFTHHDWKQHVDQRTPSGTERR